MFAGFKWPKFVWNLPSGSKEKRQTLVKTGLRKYLRNLEVNPRSTGFMMNGPDMPELKWQYADEHFGVRKRAYKADDWSGLEFRGIVMILPNRRGYLAGWTDTEYGTVDYDIFDNMHDAAIYADDLALSACEREIYFQQQQEQEDETEEL
jgi:hypothetical protein